MLDLRHAFLRRCLFEKDQGSMNLDSKTASVPSIMPSNVAAKKLLLAESGRVAHATGALRTRDIKRVTVDTTVQPKAITFPTDTNCYMRRSTGS